MMEMPVVVMRMKVFMIIKIMMMTLLAVIIMIIVLKTILIMILLMVKKAGVAKIHKSLKCDLRGKTIMTVEMT